MAFEIFSVSVLLSSACLNSSLAYAYHTRYVFVNGRTNSNLTPRALCRAPTPASLPATLLSNINSLTCKMPCTPKKKDLPAPDLSLVNINLCSIPG